MDEIRLKRANIRTLVPQLASNRTKSRRMYNLMERDCNPHEPSTFVKMESKASLLHVKGLHNRLVISLPEGLHDLRTTRFFLLVKSNQPHKTLSMSEEG
jgi:hypothetical protein